MSALLPGLLLLTPPRHPLSDFLDWVEAWLHRLLYLPVEASKIAPRIDELQYFQFVGFMLLGAVALGATFWFVVRYRRGGLVPMPTPHLESPLWLELVVGGTLLGGFVIFWIFGFRQYVDVETPPPGAMDVYVVAKQWVWKFDYPDGPSSTGVLYVPLGQPVRLLLTSRDVIHSWFVPAFRLKQDTLPGRYTTIWFTAEKTGRFDILCAEYCGAGHSQMWGQVVVLPAPQFADWLAERGNQPPQPPLGESALTAPQSEKRVETVTMAERGLRVAAEQGCLRCHSIDGTPHIGPTWKGLWRSAVRFTDGTTAVADPAYLTESMMDPAARVVAGYSPVMPTYQGRLAPAEAAALVELIHSLATEANDIAPAEPAPLPAGKIRAEPGPGTPVPGTTATPPPQTEPPR